MAQERQDLKTIVTFVTMSDNMYVLYDDLPRSVSRGRSASQGRRGKGKGKGRGKPVFQEMPQQLLNVHRGTTIPIIDVSSVKKENGSTTIKCNFRNFNCNCAYCSDKSDATSVKLTDNIRQIFSNFCSMYLPEEKIKEISQTADDGSLKRPLWGMSLLDQNRKGAYLTKYMEKVLTRNGKFNSVHVVTASVVCDNHTLASMTETRAPLAIMSFLASGLPDDDFVELYTNKFREFYTKNGVDALSILQEVSHDSRKEESVKYDVVTVKTEDQD